jgi:hypothetical protein
MTPTNQRSRTPVDCPSGVEYVDSIGYYGWQLDAMNERV